MNTRFRLWVLVVGSEIVEITNCVLRKNLRRIDATCFGVKTEWQIVWIAWQYILILSMRNNMNNIARILILKILWNPWCYNPESRVYHTTACRSLWIESSQLGHVRGRLLLFGRWFLFDCWSDSQITPSVVHTLMSAWVLSSKTHTRKPLACWHQHK